MQGLADSFWRAAAYCLHPRVIGLSLLPLVIGGLLSSTALTLLLLPTLYGTFEGKSEITIETDEEVI